MESDLMEKDVGMNPGFARKVSSVSLLLILAITLLVGRPAQASLILETATFGGGSHLGATITWEQYLGARFTLPEAARITAIGGNITNSNGSDNSDATIFGAIIPLASPTALPSVVGRDIQSIVLASTLFLAPAPSNDILAPIDVTLEPGTYGLVFGGADTALSYYPLGATGTGVMPTNGVDMPGVSYFFSYGYNNCCGWVDGGSHGFSGARFLVEGDFLADPVPEPSTLLLLASGVAGVGGMAWRRNRKGRSSGLCQRPD